jgi:O-glycosyl hydrolase
VAGKAEGSQAFLQSRLNVLLQLSVAVVEAGVTVIVDWNIVGHAVILTERGGNEQISWFNTTQWA